MMAQVPSIYTALIGTDDEEDRGQRPLKTSTIKRRKKRGSTKHIKKKKVQFQLPTQTRLMKMTEEIEFGSESGDESEDGIRSEEEETETLLSPMPKPQQTEHERKVELNQQKRKNKRGPNSQLKLETKTSWDLTPAKIQPILAPRTRDFHPVQPSEETLGPQMPLIVQGREDADGMLGIAQKVQQPDAK